MELTMNKRLQLARKLKSLKLKEFAHLTGVEQSYLSRIEKGERPVPLKIFKQLVKEFELVDAVYFNVCDAVREFYKDKDNMKFADIIIEHLNKMLEI